MIACCGFHVPVMEKCGIDACWQWFEARRRIPCRLMFVIGTSYKFPLGNSCLFSIKIFVRFRFLPVANRAHFLHAILPGFFCLLRVASDCFLIGHESVCLYISCRSCHFPAGFVRRPTSCGRFVLVARYACNKPTNHLPTIKRNRFGI